MHAGVLLLVIHDAGLSELENARDDSITCSLRISSRKHSPISSIVFARSDTYTAAGEDFQLHNLSATQPWTKVDSTIHYSRLAASRISGCRETSDHVTYATPFGRKRRLKFYRGRIVTISAEGAHFIW